MPFFFKDFQRVAERIVVVSILVLDKLCIIILKFQYCMYYSLLNFSKENFIEKHKSGENPKIQTNTQNPLKTSIFNLI